jgi:hypothetical protein
MSLRFCGYRHAMTINSMDLWLTHLCAKDVHARRTDAPLRAAMVRDPDGHVMQLEDSDNGQ